MATLLPEPGMVPWGEGVWGDTFLPLPEGPRGSSYRNVITGEMVAAVEREEGMVLSLAEVFAEAPVALLGVAVVRQS